jgi:site-specific DNA recombinase
VQRLGYALPYSRVASRHVSAEVSYPIFELRTRAHRRPNSHEFGQAPKRELPYCAPRKAAIAHPFEVKEGDRRIRVEYRINEAEAKIVREIFERYADGDGLRIIAKDLQKRGVPAPKAGRRGIGLWAYSSIREMLRRDRYRAVIIWGKQEKTYRGGTRVRVSRSKDEWVTIDVPELRTVDDDVWNIVQGKVAQYKEVFGAKTRGPTPKYLLTGLGRCSTCGGMIHVARTRKSYETVAAYTCSKRKNLGSFACKNSLRRPVESIDKAVLGWIRDNVLTEKMLMQTIGSLRQTLTNRAQNVGSELPELEAQVQSVKAELTRLTNALLVSDDKPEIVLRMISEREKRLALLNARLINSRTAPSVHEAELRNLEKTARERQNELRGVFARDSEEARRALEAILAGPLKFTPVERPEGRRYEVEGRVTLDGLYLTESVPSGSRTVLHCD